MAAVKKINLKASRIKIYYFLIFYQLNKWLQNFVILTLRYFLLELFVRTNVKKYEKLDTFKKVYNNFSLIQLFFVQFYFFHKICDLYFKGSCQVFTSIQLQKGIKLHEGSLLLEQTILHGSNFLNLFFYYHYYP